MNVVQAQEYYKNAINDALDQDNEEQFIQAIIELANSNFLLKGVNLAKVEDQSDDSVKSEQKDEDGENPHAQAISKNTDYEEEDKSEEKVELKKSKLQDSKCDEDQRRFSERETIKPKIRSYEKEEDIIQPKEQENQKNRSSLSKTTEDMPYKAKQKNNQASISSNGLPNITPNSGFDQNVNSNIQSASMMQQPNCFMNFNQLQAQMNMQQMNQFQPAPCLFPGQMPPNQFAGGAAFVPAQNNFPNQFPGQMNQFQNMNSFPQPMMQNQQMNYQNFQNFNQQQPPCNQFGMNFQQNQNFNQNQDQFNQQQNLRDSEKPTQPISSNPLKNISPPQKQQRQNQSNQNNQFGMQQPNQILPANQMNNAAFNNYIPQQMNSAPYMNPQQPSFMMGNQPNWSNGQMQAQQHQFPFGLPMYQNYPQMQSYPQQIPNQQFNPQMQQQMYQPQMQAMLPQQNQMQMTPQMNMYQQPAGMGQNNFY